MADIELVIKIPEEEYESIKKHPHWHSLGELITHGIPLPKGHGRLIDLDYLYDFDRRKVEYAPTIIEADKEE